jgi:hypothetical protein
MAHKPVHLRARTLRAGHTIALDFDDVVPEVAAGADTPALLVDFLETPNALTSTVIHHSNLADIKQNKQIIQLQGVGTHTVFLVIFDKGGDNVSRFLSFHTDPILTIA